MRKLLYNGKFYISKNNFADFVIIDGDRIAEVGKICDLSKLKFDTKINLHGKTCLPGLNDSHCHAYGVGNTFSNLDLEKATSIQEMITISKDYLDKNRNMTKLLGIHFNQENFIKDGKRYPNKQDLDQISTEIPVLLERVCSHKCVVNSKILDMIDQVELEKFIASNEVEVIAGEPTGLFSEKACFWIKSIISPLTIQDKKAHTLKAFDYALSCGLTTLQSNDIGFGKAYEEYQYIRELAQDKSVKIRYTLQSAVKSIHDIETVINPEKNSGYYDDKKFRFGAIKMFKDGSLGSSTALLTESYADDENNFGTCSISKDEQRKFMEIAVKNGYQVLTHAIGDKAIAETLDVYQESFINGKNDLRHGIIHCQITSQKLLERLAKLNIEVFYQPIFLASDMYILENRVGKQLAQTSYAYKTLHKLGGKISFGTDGPVEDINPFPNIASAVTRANKNAEPSSVYNKDEQISVSDAIDFYTIGSAHAEFMENEKGRIKAGYLADLTVIDKDIFEINPFQIKDIKCVMTIVGGEIVYQR